MRSVAHCMFFRICFQIVTCSPSFMLSRLSVTISTGSRGFLANIAWNGDFSVGSEGIVFIENTAAWSALAHNWG